MTSSFPIFKSWFRILLIWAISFGGIIGWSSFVLPGTMFLPVAGPRGTVIALLAGGIAFTMIAANFHNMMNRKGNTGRTGGVFSYTKEIFGYDYSLICVWSMLIAYISIMCTNATAFAFFARYLFGPVFQWGFCYTVAGYEVWLGEIVVAILILASTGILCAKSHRIVRALQVSLAVILFAGVTVIFALAFYKTGFNFASFKPGFAQHSGGSSRPFVQVLSIAALSPWLFIGFCVGSLLPGKSEFSDGSFPVKKSFAIMAVAIFCGMLTYILLAMLATLSLPQGCQTWSDYTARLDEYKTLAALPTFYAAQTLLGKGGTVVLALCAVAAMLTGILCMYRAAARLLQSMAEDDVLPHWFERLNKNGLPQNSTVFIMLISLAVPFCGRTIFGWIVDVTTITAAISYASVSAASFVVAKKEKNPFFITTGIIGVLASVFCCSPIIPTTLNPLSLSKSAHLILAAWAMIGLVMFRFVFIRDKKNRFGTSTIMWMIMIFIVLISSMMWQRQSTYEKTEEIILQVSDFHQFTHGEEGIPMTASQLAREQDYMEDLMTLLRNSNLANSIVQFVMILASLAIMLNIFITQKNREKKLSSEKSIAENANKAKSRFLSLMSHDIRTPMNAILGMNEMILREAKSEAILDYASNISTSGRTLLSLIDSILDFSKIEEDKMEIIPVQYETALLINNVIDSIANQTEAKGLELVPKIDASIPSVLFGDDIRISQVILNLLSNAVKYTNRGRITLTMRAEEAEGETLSLYVEVSDTGIGIKKEDMTRLFEPFERLDEEKNHNIQGTGLGISIVTRLLLLMGSQLEVESTYGAGTTFYFRLRQKIVNPAPMGDYRKARKTSASESKTEITLYAPLAKILVADDNETNLKVAKNFLKLMGIVPDMVTNGFAVLEKMRKKSYHIVLLDHMMPHIDGTETLRRLKSENLVGDTAVIAFTANIVEHAKKQYREAGFAGILSKPLEIEKLQELLNTFLPKDLLMSKDSPSENAGMEDSGILEFAPQPDSQAEDTGLTATNSEAAFALLKEALGKNGISADVGLHFYADDKDFYTEMLEGFASSQEEKAAELSGYEQSGDLKNYRILVHALKSNAKGIGAASLSEAAKQLEDAARDGNAEFIRERHEAFICAFRETAKTIQSALLNAAHKEI